MKNRLALFSALLALCAFLPVSFAQASTEGVAVSLSMDEAVLLPGDGGSLGEDLQGPGLNQIPAHPADKGEPLRDACRCEGSTLVINAKVNVRVSNNMRNLFISIRFEDDVVNGGKKMVYNPSVLEFTIPAGQTENTEDFVVSIKSLSKGVYTLQAIATLYDTDEGKYLVDGSGNNEFADSENLAINRVVFGDGVTPPSCPADYPCAINPGGGPHVFRYTIEEAQIAPGGSIYACNFTSATLVVYNSDNQVLYSMPVTYTPGTYQHIWNVPPGLGVSNFYFGFIMGKRVQVDSTTIDLLPEPAATTNSAGLSLWRLRIRTPDSGSGVDMSTVTPALIAVSITPEGEATTNVAHFEHYIAGTEKSFFPMRSADPGDYHIFLASKPADGIIIRYTVVMELLDSASGMDLAGNEWDLDPTKPGRQTKITWSGFYITEEGDPVDPTAVIHDLDVATE